VISAYGIGQAQSWLKPRIQRALIYSIGIALVASLLSLVLSMNWTFDSTPSEFFQWPGVIYWFSVTAVWVVVGLGSWFIARKFLPATSAGKRPRHLTAAFAMSASALVLTSVFTRPAVLWTESRPLFTDIGVVTPSTESGDASSSPSAVGNLFTDQVSAAEWVVAETERFDQIATNAPMSAFIPALTGNQMFLAGSLYQAGLGDTSELAEVVRRREISGSLSIAVLVDPSQRLVLQELCNAGVAYLWLEGPAGLGEITPAYSNDSVSVFPINNQCAQFSSS
jgi:hypothetical protein